MSEDENKKKRKLHDGPEIEIDISAPEPPSKKALRKAKKKGTDVQTEPTKVSTADSEKESKSRSVYGVWVGNLPFSTSKDDLRKFFTSNCTFADTTITRIHIPQGPSRNGMPQNKGFAYVDFATQKAMDEAIGLSEQLILGRRALIKGAQNFQGRPDQDQQASVAKSSATSGHPPSRRIFVGNLGFDATKEALEEHFSPCGNISDIHLATFEDSGKCKGYGWLEFESIESAQHAVNGFVKVEEDGEEEEEEEASASESDGTKPAKKRSKSKKLRMKKVWVNRLLGRQLRMEFAEDAATRYKKRYGKDSSKGRPQHSDNQDGEKGSWKGRPKKEDRTPSRYSKDTVQRLTGAIVEAQGQKVTFD
ncbi:putative RNA binding protein Rnp24 [Talaromyces proteolyticus]|uniref:RNA binding protein Rnp24 n=1 Tax=Talaromyces proteolyticus TaxID=1131652 RepID=A0AAD4KE24_9EURO|nr:putative RNA binding protein Rnp24 [Talaromyces proteolyticus]KAH8688829.1 putative RNA binding protein Rnp24 [Talaromyces proteolyticus]